MTGRAGPLGRPRVYPSPVARRPDGRGAPAPGDRPRLRPARGRARGDRARRGGALRPVAVPRDGRPRADRRSVPRGGRWGRVLVPCLDAGHGGARRGGHGHGRSLSVHILSQYPVVTWGTDEQRARWLPAMQTGEALGAFALTEPHAGSDAAALRTRAVRAADGTSYRLAGTKSWISNAPEADRYLVFATVDPAAGSRGITAFLVERGCAGFRIGPHERKMGIRACPAAELVFEGCDLSRRRTASARRARATASPCRAGRGSDLHRGGVRRPGPGRAGGRGPVPRRAPGVRRAPGRPAGAPLPARRDGPGRGGSPRPDPRGGRGQGPRRASGRGLVAGQVDRLGRGDAGRDRRGPAVRW